MMRAHPALEEESTMSNVTVQDLAEPEGGAGGAAAAPYPVSFRASVTGLLVLEIVLGLSSNLTVLVLYCMKSDLINSVSNVVTVNLHVLDVTVCVLCIPLTVAVALLPPGGGAPLVSCFHEACVSFASVATAANVLAITLDRYDISVRPANRVLTMGRAAALLGAVWAVSAFSFLVPFAEVGFFSQGGGGGGGGAGQNRTTAGPGAGAAGGRGSRYRREPGMYYHLLAQIPIFCFTAAVMLFTYAKIMRALNIRIGARFHAAQRKKAARRKKATAAAAAGPPAAATQQDAAEASQDGAAAAAATTAATAAASATTGGGGGRNPTLGMRASVSVIIALRRAVRRHRERRERQRRVFRMSLLIVSTFLLCWTPITALNAAVLGAGPGAPAPQLRLAFLVMAYGTTVFHPLLYAFARQKFQKVLRSKMKKRVVSVVEAEPLPSNAVIHNSWIDPERNRTVTFAGGEMRPKGPSSEEVP
ncbi:G-protein coupled receptor 22-like [Anguilla anguilla]|uniref:G-protein coupled receptor 22-like n=1 Tax=Anguilla anguilla TaxID=7936 RepID=UPI0015B16C79|nr:G-protein coupled receptor 22-like [Anguilla anguilla]